MPKSPESLRGNVPVIGVVGGIGSGKSRLARLLGERSPISVIDADAVGHQVLKEDQVKQAISARFGGSVFDASGDVDRPALGRVVFGTNQESVDAKHDLERIVHPRIGEILRKQIATAKSDPSVIAVVLDAAVLLEAGWKDLCDAIVFIDVPDDVRRRRVIENRNWSAAEFESREANQLSLMEKKKRADFEIDNSESVEKAVSEFQRLLRTILLQTITTTPPPSQG